MPAFAPHREQPTSSAPSTHFLARPRKRRVNAGPGAIAASQARTPRLRPRLMAHPPGAPSAATAEAPSPTRGPSSPTAPLPLAAPPTTCTGPQSRPGRGCPPSSKPPPRPASRPSRASGQPADSRIPQQRRSLDEPSRVRASRCRLGLWAGELAPGGGSSCPPDPGNHPRQAHRPQSPHLLPALIADLVDRPQPHLRPLPRERRRTLERQVQRPERRPAAPSSATRAGQNHPLDTRLNGRGLGRDWARIRSYRGGFSPYRFPENTRSYWVCCFPTMNNGIMVLSRECFSPQDSGAHPHLPCAAAHFIPRSWGPVCSSA